MTTVMKNAGQPASGMFVSKEFKPFSGNNLISELSKKLTKRMPQ
jgi:hypothetical protein